MRTGRTTRSADTTRAFAVLAITLAKGADAQQPATRPKSGASLHQEPNPGKRAPKLNQSLNSLTSPNRKAAMPSSRTPRAFAIGFMTVALLAGCMTTDPDTGEKKVTRTSRDAGIGAVAGAVLGAAVSSKSDRGKGALIGAAAGGGIGAAIGHRADKQEAELRKQLENSGVEVQRQGDTINLVVPNAISFATNSAQLTSNFYGPLNDVATSLKSYPDTTVQIVGHTDSTGAAAYNQQLSVNRANAVVVYLTAQGVVKERMQAVGMGSNQPIADNKTADGRAQNRRVEIKIIPREAPQNG